MKKLFLLDGMALIYRAHFAFVQNPRITTSGLNTSAVFGFTNTLLDIIKKEKPTHLAVVFDTKAPTDRHIEFEAYKAHREEMPEDLSKALPYVFKVIEGMRIPVITYDGYEADDIIGTLAKKAQGKGYDVFMMTPDKDFGQLVDEHIKIYKPPYKGNEYEILGVEEVKKRWEIDDVKKVIDILGLWGDASDNIPGIPGVGEKTAKTLVQKYGSMENIYAHIDELKGKQKENFINFKEQGLLSKRLATINIEVPIDLDEKGLELEEPDKEKLEPLFAELEFKTLGRRVFGETVNTSTINQDFTTDLFGNPLQQKTVPKPQAAEPEEGGTLKSIHEVPHQYQLVDTEAKRKELIALLAVQKSFCFDTETTGTDVMEAEIVGVAFSYQKHHGYYVTLPENQEEATSILAEFKQVLEDEQIEKVGQNLKYDYAILKKYGIEVSGPFFDTMLAHYLMEPDQRHNMDILSENYLNYSPVSIEKLIGKKGVGQLSMRQVDVNVVKEYSSEDADVTLQLKLIFENDKLFVPVQKVFREVEIPLIKVLADMELEGVRIDKQALNDFSKLLDTDIIQLEKDIYKLSGTTFNIASPKQLGEVLFDLMRLDPKAKKTKTGQYKTDEEVLTQLSYEHEIAAKIVEYRQLQKLKSTYVDALPLMISKKTGRVHTSYNQAVAATGRLSSNNPNLQNIPIRTEKGREVRKAFVPRDDNHVLLSADYSQIELRIIASMAGDEGMIEAFEKGVDIHSATAAKVFGVELSDVTKEMRRKAKVVNFGIIYGISAFGLAQRLDIPRKEAAEIIDQYFEKFPGIKRYMNDTINFAREHGYVETVLGRRRYIRDINSANATVRGFAERNAINAPIQGSAADMIKVAMISLHAAMAKKKFKSKMILQVHDELVFDVLKSELDELKPLVQKHMVEALPLRVPIESEMGSGQNWLEAH